MRKVEYWEADNGKEFETEEECYEYEHRFDVIKERAIIYTVDGKPFDFNRYSVDYCVCECGGMYVPDVETAQALKDVFDEEGYSSPWDNWDEEFSTGFFYFDDEWVNLDTEINRLDDIRRSYANFT